ncbi:GFA family protein [Candidatus Parcubacteria bacterium]|uniref:Aldehyde-activating protein n=1 Tax=Candidatus Kaiserbacteria bacterium CG10_big_fil_rev_8_21_14_0_10_47_16 TaxID=1974608 RepID=A0A2H0UEG4_9BACT|nr:GFA family protein [Candidatus Parcubacteria bacterium]PIR84799.1 MAG: aldehyde-activating protein [Candidatus Kaiserbacteria bacterium CG10_big_fil_rev_8_21_14_0_10_47_16]
METQTYVGGCHCGKVQYEVDMNLENVMECNCSHCAKKGFLLSFVPATQFRLLRGEDALSEYRFNKKHIAHLFCTTCGVESFARGTDKEGAETIMINARCLDDVVPDTLTITKVDGKNF